MRPSTLAELADAAGIAVPEIRGYGSFTAFADTYLAACQVLRTPDDFARLVYEVVEDSVLDGAVWVEPSFYAPHHRDRFGADEDIVDMVLDAAARGRREARCRRRRDGRGRPHRRSGDRGRAGPDRRRAGPGAAWSRSGSPTTRRSVRRSPSPRPSPSPRRPGCSPHPHAGELAGPESVWGALETLAPDRLQHGVRAIEDPELVSRLADSDVVLDVCPTSNLLLSVYPSLAEHPLPQPARGGCPVQPQRRRPAAVRAGAARGVRARPQPRWASTTTRWRRSRGHRSTAQARRRRSRRRPTLADLIRWLARE